MSEDRILTCMPRVAHTLWRELTMLMSLDSHLASFGWTLSLRLVVNHNISQTWFIPSMCFVT